MEKLPAGTVVLAFDHDEGGEGSKLLLYIC
jgi:hypothetical protein